MNRPNPKKPQDGLITIDPVTLAVIGVAVLLVPLLLSGFLFQ